MNYEKMLVSISLIPVLASTMALSLVAKAHRGSEVMKERYRWVRAVGSGRPGWPRWVVPIVGRDGKLWTIDKDATWSSSNGTSWTPTKHNAGQAVRPGVAQAYFRQNFWLMGGMNTWSEFTNEVWHSTDGVNWKRAVVHAPWGPRRNAMIVVFAGKLWLLGGQISSGDARTGQYRDVWYTSDGVNWNRVTDSAPWREGHAVIFKNKIWVIGGGGAWHSINGREWTPASANVDALKRGGNGCAVFDGKIWIYGGIRQEKMGNDVWSSDDGVQWNLVTEHAPWFPRGGAYTITFDNKLWIFGGKTGVDYDQADDIWYMTRE